FGEPEAARDPVNDRMIRQWCDAMGDRNPIYWDATAAEKTPHGGIVAPPTMLQAWILSGFRMADAERPARDRQEKLHALFAKHGYTGVVATNCEQEDTRYLHAGERGGAVATIASLSQEDEHTRGDRYIQ